MSSGSASGASTVLRSIGKWSLAALVLNGVLGSGVFALPGTVAARLGWWSLLALVLAALVASAIMLSFAEVASRFDEAGGPYLYARVAFGRLMGLQMGWMAYFVRVISSAVQVNLLTTYLAELWAPASTPEGGAFAGALFLGVLCVINLRGVSSGTLVSNIFAVVKLLPMLLFGALGLAWLAGGLAVPAVTPMANSPGGWLTVLLLLMFSYGGFEASTIPLGEAKDPKRHIPFALITGLAAVVVIYLLVQVAVLVTLPDPEISDRPLAEMARVFLGGPGAVVMSLAALVSVSGWGASGMVAIPRLTYAMAERGDLPAVFCWVHPRWRTPWVSILTYTGLTYVLSLQGGLLSNITLSTVSRLLTYGLVCAALMVFRRWDAAGPGRVSEPGFRAPAGWLMAGGGLAASVLLVTRMTPREGIWLLVVVAVALGHRL
ncbi:MAG: APC family permease, partial [Gemmatimonadota bacterium]